MKSIFTILLLFQSIFIFGQQFMLENRSGQDCQIKVWYDDEFKYSGLFPNQTLIRGEGIQRGVLLRWKFECDDFTTYPKDCKILDDGWVERFISIEYLNLNKFQFNLKKCPRA